MIWARPWATHHRHGINKRRSDPHGAHRHTGNYNQSDRVQVARARGYCPNSGYRGAKA